MANSEEEFDKDKQTHLRYVRDWMTQPDDGLKAFLLSGFTIFVIKRLGNIQVILSARNSSNYKNPWTGKAYSGTSVVCSPSIDRTEFVNKFLSGREKR